MTHLLLERGVRRKLPDLRHGTTQKVTIEHPDNKLYIRTGLYEDGDLGEIFLDMNKQGALLQAFTHSFAKVVSIDLQYGAPLDLFVDHFAGYSFKPSGPVNGHNRIRETSSPLDATFRHLGIIHLGRMDLVNPVGERKLEDDAGPRSVALQLLKPFSNKRGERKRLPDRRACGRQKLSIAGQKFYLETGHYGDRTTDPLGEIFITMHKEGDDLRAMMNAFGIAVSFGLQYGVPLDEFVDAFAGARFEPAGKVEGHDQILYAQSYFDCVFRILGLAFLEGRGDLASPAAPEEPAAAGNEPH